MNNNLPIAQPNIRAGIYWLLINLKPKLKIQIIKVMELQ